MGSTSKYLQWFLALLLCWGLPSPHTTLSYAAVYYVTPHTPNPDCPTSGEPCLTLNEYAQGNHFDGDENITLLFLNGEHNLTAQDLEIDHKTMLKMAHSSIQAKPAIKMSAGTCIKVKNIFELQFTGLRLQDIYDSDHDNVSACFLASDIGLLSVTRVSIISCRLSLQGEINGTITELIAHKSFIAMDSSQNNHTVAVKNSEFHFSTLNISSLGRQIRTYYSKTNTLMLQSSSMRHSLLTLTLQTQIAYELMIIDTSFIRQDNKTSETGIKIETLNTAKLIVLIYNSSYIGNYQGITLIADGNSSVQLNVEHCYIAKNSHTNRLAVGTGISVTADGSCRVELNVNQCHIVNNGNQNQILDYTHLGGISVGRKSLMNMSNAETIVNITSTTLSDNSKAQVGVMGSSGATTVTVFNCTLSNRRSSYQSDGFKFNFGQIPVKSMFINLTQNRVENTNIGIWIEGARMVEGPNCMFDVHLIGNSFNSVKASSYIPGGYGLQIIDSKKMKISIIDCFFIQIENAAIMLYDTSGIVTISGTTISQNHNAIVINCDESQKMNVSMTIKNSTFQESEGVCLGVPSLQFFDSANTPLTADITLNSVTFLNNTSLLPNTGIVLVDKRIKLYIEDSCVFRGNYGSSIQALATTVTLLGVITFEDNTAFQGGAISMSFSTLKFRVLNNSTTIISFVNNIALNTGGGIYIDQSTSIDPYSGSGCFYELEEVTYKELEHNLVSLVFQNNTSGSGGLDIFGVTPASHCNVNANHTSDSHRVSSKVQNYIFSSFNFSQLSSEPMRVCLCSSPFQLQCANLSYIFYDTTRYPGEIFTLSLAVVGFDFGTVDGPVYAKVLRNNSSSSYIGRDQNVRQVDYAKCTQLDFSLNSLNPRDTIILTPNLLTTRVAESDASSDINALKNAINKFEEDEFKVIPFTLLTTPVYIRVKLLRCPPGFNLSESGLCDCTSTLENIGIKNCFIHNRVPYITRSGNEWIRPVFNPDGILSTKYCPFNYCKQELLNLSILYDPDAQCAPNHIGILCGACLSNLSLAIGSSRCLNCTDNSRLLLLIAFAAAGVLLVLFIKILNVTVTTGTINGLIFYANIIWANQSVLFPPQAQTSSLLQFLKVFIAWLNLDLGIETCFIQHLDGYWKTWLQFVFPAYIWLIAGLIILASHYSIRATKLFGNNSVSVLATLLLLSYAKLLRIILIVFDFTTLQYPDGQVVVWSFDGNVSYFGLKHSILFAAAAVILLTLWLPYTFALLFVQCLRKHSHHCFLRWVNKLYPMFDSYLGPFKVKHQYWIGLGLLARLVLLLTSTVTLTTMPFMGVLIVTLTTVLLCLIVPSVYKQWQLSVLEGGFLFNIAVFSNGALFVESQGGSKDSLACTSLGISFILFLAVIGYHVYKKCQLLKRKRGYEDIDGDVQEHYDQARMPVTYQVVDLSASTELREPLLESNN